MPFFLNPHTKLHFNSDNPYSYCLPPQNICDKFTIIRNICRFLQPGFISSVSFREKLSLPNVKHNRIYKSIVELIPNNCIHLLKTKTSQQSLLKVFFILTTEALMRTIINLSNSFHGQITLKGILFSTLNPGAKFLLIGSKIAQMATFS